MPQGEGGRVFVVEQTGKAEVWEAGLGESQEGARWTGSRVRRSGGWYSTHACPREFGFSSVTGSV